MQCRRLAPANRRVVENRCIESGNPNIARGPGRWNWQVIQFDTGHY